MKLVRVGERGSEIPGVLNDDLTSVLDARPVTADFDSDFFADGGLDRLRNAVRDGKLSQLRETNLRMGAPVFKPEKIICIGLNYRNHARESGMEVPKEPIIFMKAPNTLVGPNDDVLIPHKSLKTDWEIELAVVMRETASYLKTPNDGLKYVAGYAVANDVSEREFQLERGGQWDKGKSCATFNPLGPWLVTADEIPDPQQLQMFLEVNGQRMQSENTSDMIFSVSYLIWYVSQFMVLEPGDIINTGTPSGVGLGLQPPRYLKPGDEMRLNIEGLGEHCSRAVVTP
jgi:2-keto-4-pentenoate hydratase/2-oxohepta-3-ene-1,7-dioic acid hydratase in catechol pathway